MFRHLDPFFFHADPTHNSFACTYHQSSKFDDVATAPIYSPQGNDRVYFRKYVFRLKCVSVSLEYLPLYTWSLTRIVTESYCILSLCDIGTLSLHCLHVSFPLFLGPYLSMSFVISFHVFPHSIS